MYLQHIIIHEFQRFISGVCILSRAWSVLRIIRVLSTARLIMNTTQVGHNLFIFALPFFLAPGEESCGLMLDLQVVAGIGWLRSTI